MSPAAPAIPWGVWFEPTQPVRRLVDLAKLAEGLGAEVCLVADEGTERDVYVALTAILAASDDLVVGPAITNPFSRHPVTTAAAVATLAEMAPGRTMLGIGTGDSAVLNLGITPSSRARLRDYVGTVRELLATGHSEWEGRPCRMTWGGAVASRIPIYLAASGPRMLRLAGEIGDGVIINTGLTPDIVRESIAQVRAGAESAGRSLDEIDLWWLPVANVRSDRAAAIDEVAMTLASAGSHLSRFTTKGKHIPRELHDAVVALGDRYRPEEHSKPDSSNRGIIRELGLLDYLADRFAIAGTPQDCVAKIEAAVEAGARQFWMSIHFDDKERFLHDWKTVMAAFR